MWWSLDYKRLTDLLSTLLTYIRKLEDLSVDEFLVSGFESDGDDSDAEGEENVQQNGKEENVPAETWVQSILTLSSLLLCGFTSFQWCFSQSARCLVSLLLPVLTLLRCIEGFPRRRGKRLSTRSSCPGFRQKIPNSTSSWRLMTRSCWTSMTQTALRRMRRRTSITPYLLNWRYAYSSYSSDDEEETLFLLVIICS